MKACLHNPWVKAWLGKKNGGFYTCGGQQRALEQAKRLGEAWA
jgi:hypothetical protein